MFAYNFHLFLYIIIYITHIRIHTVDVEWTDADILAYFHDKFDSTVYVGVTLPYVALEDYIIQRHPSWLQNLDGIGSNAFHWNSFFDWIQRGIAESKRTQTEAARAEYEKTKKKTRSKKKKKNEFNAADVVFDYPDQCDVGYVQVFRCDFCGVPECYMAAWYKNKNPHCRNMQPSSGHVRKIHPIPWFHFMLSIIYDQLQSSTVSLCHLFLYILTGKLGQHITTAMRMKKQRSWRASKVAKSIPSINGTIKT